jgi:putative heme-binding domain-containing protein
MLSGVIGRDTAETITLHMAANQSRTVDREDILSMEPSALSIMPEGLDAGLKDEELVDLITFLLSLNNEKWLQPVQRGAKKKPRR